MILKNGKHYMKYKVQVKWSYYPKYCPIYCIYDYKIELRYNLKKIYLHKYPCYTKSPLLSFWDDDGGGP